MEKFNAVLIGTGNMGKVHLQSALDSPYINELFLCDLSAEVLNSTAACGNVENLRVARRNKRVLGSSISNGAYVYDT